MSKKETFDENIQIFSKCVNCEQLYETILRHTSRMLDSELWKVTCKVSMVFDI